MFSSESVNISPLLVVNGMIVDDVDSKEDPIDEDSPSLYECLEMVRRLRVLSNTQQPELHPFLMQL